MNISTLWIWIKKQFAPEDGETDLSRRGFITSLIGATAGALVLPLKTIVTVPAMPPVACLRALPQPLYDSQVISSFSDGLSHISNYYKFNLGRSALKIKPGEAFSAAITIPAPKIHIIGLQCEKPFDLESLE